MVTEDFKKTKSKAPVLTLGSVVLYLFLFLLATTGITFASYLTTITGTATVMVGTPAFYLSSQDDISLDVSGFAPNVSARTYTFYVSNVDAQENTSDVPLNYTLTVSTTNNLPLIIILTRTDTTPNVTEGTITGTGSGIQGTLTSTEYIMSYYLSQETQHTYTVTISWNSSYTGEIYASGVDVISISVNWEQNTD